MPNVVRGFVSDDRALVYKSTFTIWLCTDRRDLKQTSVRVGTKLLGRNINLENVGRVLKIGASDRRKTDGREFMRIVMCLTQNADTHALKQHRLSQNILFKINRNAFFFLLCFVSGVKRCIALYFNTTAPASVQQATPHSSLPTTTSKFFSGLLFPQT